MSALYPVDGHAFGTYASVPTDIYSKRPFVMAHSRRFRKGQILNFLCTFLSVRACSYTLTTNRRGGRPKVSGHAKFLQVQLVPTSEQ